MQRLGAALGATCVLAAAGAAASAHAATACVSNTAQLALVLAAAQSNGEDDTILLEVGDYLLSGELQYNAVANETYKLTIIGGQLPGCPGPYATSGLTRLDGQHAVRMLTITAKGQVSVGRITFQNGQPSQYAGGALNIDNTSTAPTYVFSSAFVSNTDANTAGAVYVFSAGDVYFWSNLLIANDGPSAAAFYAANGYITGNTIIANSLVDHAGSGGALNPQGTGHYYVSNNILWNNEHADVYDQSGLVDYAYNDVGLITNYPAHSETHDINVDPQFNGLLSVSLAPDSPLINAGLDDPPGGVGGCCDPSGGKRVVGTHVDIGAYESDVLLRNSFE